RSETMNDALSVVAQLRDLASEPQNREAIVQDQGCLPGLVLFLDVQQDDALRYLAELPRNIPFMSGELGMMVSLENLMERVGLSFEVRSLAKEVYGILSAPVRRSPERERRKKPQFFLNATNKKAKSVTLHIQGLDSTDQRGLCEEALLKVKGVISFTFQMASKRCTVRIRSDLATESLASAIAETKVLTAKQVIKNEAGEEVLIPLNPSDVEVQQNSALPDYLPEEEEESPEKDLDRAVSRPNATMDGNGSWISAAAGFLTKTFYW
ncbi:hypothetical protein CRUP_011216, partial [Coryphaenoides rupestris]